jgi:hypothetical protein
VNWRREGKTFPKPDAMKSKPGRNKNQAGGNEIQAGGNEIQKSVWPLAEVFQ